MPTTPAYAAGRAFLDALAVRDFVALRRVLADDVVLRMLVPKGDMAETNAESAVGRFIDWCAGADPLRLDTSSVADVEGRVAVTYRFDLVDGNAHEVIEQHLMLDVGEHGLITHIDLLCSGFRPVATETGR